jgi:hypothetical protein
MQVSRAFLNDVLFTLHAAKSLDWPDLNRTNFQKILYFCATLSPLVGIEWGYGFTNAAYGPFNREIHQASDILVPYGYVEVTDLTLQRDAKLRARYKITPKGEIEVGRICQLRRERERLEWITLVMKVLDIYGPTMVTKLAYKEPTFRAVREQNRRIIDLLPDDNRSIELVQKLSAELEQKHSIHLDTLVSQLIVYFDFLSSDIGQGTEE